MMSQISHLGFLHFLISVDVEVCGISYFMKFVFDYEFACTEK